MKANGGSISIGDLGEEAVVARLLAGLPPSDRVVVGPGDDCAVVEADGDCYELLKTDAVVEGIHFTPGTDPLRVGRKVMNRTLSDMAAMAGEPDFALVTIASGGDRSVSEVEKWYEGMVEAAAVYGCSVVGGETTSLPGPGAVLSVAMTGKVGKNRCLLRSGARVGDVILVTGRLGGSFASGRHLDFSPRIREARWLAEELRPTAMMDLSDGLGSDLPRLAAASGVGYRIDWEAIPCHEGATTEAAVGEGEDYELLLTMDRGRWKTAGEAWAAAFPDLELTEIGSVTGEVETPLPKGWEHYRTS